MSNDSRRGVMPPSHCPNCLGQEPDDLLLRDEYIKAEREIARLQARVRILEEERLNAQRAEIAQLTKANNVKPVFDADSPRFREVFEDTLRASNLPLKRKGDGYRSPITQWCFEIAYGVVNRLRLYEK